MPKSKKIDPCPKCYLEDGVESQLLIKTGMTGPIQCERGHEFLDRGELGDLMIEASRARLVASKSIQPEEEAEETEHESANSGPMLNQDGKIEIGPIDFARISSIIGHFTDSSSLYGAIYALSEELSRVKAELETVRKAKVVQAEKSDFGLQKGGDVLVSVVVPERYVEPITQVAEAAGVDFHTYISDMIAHAMDNGWLF